MNYKFITRIAPSPTGLFHIGTARTALINYIFAKQNKGEFLLRMEDTDTTRNKPEFEEDIKDGLKWLNLDWDGEIVYQKNRHNRYTEVVDELIKNESAYKKDNAVWFKIPAGTIKFHDLIRGEIQFDSKDIKDFVILRSDGSPIFYLSGVVDDHDSQITHVIRGEEHLSNTTKQILLLQALDWNLPTYAHVPLILNPDRSKMSKRKDPVSITKDFQEKGFLPEAMNNYLFLLGFHPTEKELKVKSEKLKVNGDIYNINEMKNIFDITRMQKGGAVFDQEKLDNINHYYIQKMTVEELLSDLKKYQGDIAEDTFKKFIAIIKPRLKKLSGITVDINWLEKPADYQPDILVFKKSTKETTLIALRAIEARSKKQEAWDITSLQKLLEETVVENNLQNGDVFWSVRVALSGLEKSPPPQELMWVLGKEESINRIKTAIEKLIMYNS